MPPNSPSLPVPASPGTSIPPASSTPAGSAAAAMVAQACAIAVQDAVDGLRNIEAISTTAIGVALAQFLATKDETYLKALTQVQSVMSQAVTSFQSVGTTAGTVLQAFVNTASPKN